MFARRGVSGDRLAVRLCVTRWCSDECNGANLVFTGDGKGKTTRALGMALTGRRPWYARLRGAVIKNDASTGKWRPWPQ